MPERGQATGYGVIEFFDGLATRRWSVGYEGAGADIELNGALRVVKHPLASVPCDSTEDERAALGVTW